MRRNSTPTTWLEGAQRQERWEYPEEAIREVLVNALVHRDYSVAGTDIMLSIFSNRLEIQSPGRLPNTVTIDGMKLGVRYARNQTLVNVLRDYGYVDARGMGIRNKVIPSMRAHNDTEPDFVEGREPLHCAPVEGAEAPMIPKEFKRLARFDFPIAEASNHASREKLRRHWAILPRFTRGSGESSFNW